MLVSLRWLATWCWFPDDTTLINDLNRIGFEVESITKKGADLSGIVTGQITTWSSHPNADRLHIADVCIGDESVQIVTAATNVKQGDIIPVSLPGATLAGGMTITASKLRGVPSNGMMCSAVECGLTDSSPGVWVLPPDVPLGLDFIEYAQLVDTVIDVAILPNRGDAMSLMGLARDIRALYGDRAKSEGGTDVVNGGGIDPDSPMTRPSVSSSESSPASKPPLNSGVSCPDDCSYYRIQQIDGAGQGTTPVVWQTRLYYSGCRPLYWPVDVTNIVMIEMGQPLHAFDADGIHTISVESLGTPQSVTLLNDTAYSLDVGVPVITINNQSVGAVAGVMGAQAHSVTHQTNNIILEAACFNPVTIRRTTKQLGLRSDSATRFEKGVDPMGLHAACRRAVALLTHRSPCTVHDPVEVGNTHVEPRTIQLDEHALNQFLGKAFSWDDLSRQLSPLGFQVDAPHIHVPSWRIHDCQEWPDIAEEMIRFLGMDAVPMASPTTVSRVQHDPRWKQRNTVSATAVSLGFMEVIPFPLVAEDASKQARAIQNPIVAELSFLRSNATSSMIQTAKNNALRHTAPNRLFSCGPVWDDNGQEKWTLSMLMQGVWHHQPHRENQTNTIDFYDVKGCLDTVLASLGVAYDVQPCPDVTWCHPGQSARVMVNGQSVGFFGMVHPTVAQSHRLPLETGVIDIDLDGLTGLSKPHYESVSKFPSTTRDTTYIMDAHTSVGEVLSVLTRQKPPLCTHIVVCGYYQPSGHDDVHVSFRMTYQDANASLEMSAVNDIHRDFSQSVIDVLPCRFPS